MRFAPHTALPRVKGVHQPRDSAVFFSKQTATATAGGRRASVEQVGTGGEGRRRGRAVIHILPPLFVARLCDTAGRRSPAQHAPPPPSLCSPPKLPQKPGRAYSRGIDGEGQSTLQSCAPPVSTPGIRPSLVSWVVSDVAFLGGVKDLATSFSSWSV